MSVFHFVNGKLQLFSNYIQIYANVFKWHCELSKYLANTRQWLTSTAHPFNDTLVLMTGNKLRRRGIEIK